MSQDAGGPRIDTTVAHSARVYNYWLGGKDNFEADRKAAEKTLDLRPDLRFAVLANRGFLARSVRYLAGQAGIRQFLDIGTGIPSADNTHEVAQAVAPDARIVYVDNDPVVLSHARALLTSAPRRSVFGHVEGRCEVPPGTAGLSLRRAARRRSWVTRADGRNSDITAARLIPR